MGALLGQDEALLEKLCSGIACATRKLLKNYPQLLGLLCTYSLTISNAEYLLAFPDLEYATYEHTAYTKETAKNNNNEYSDPLSNICNISGVALFFKNNSPARMISPPST